MEAYLQMGNQEEAKRSAIKMMNDIVGTLQNPNPLLFYPIIKIQEGQTAVIKEMKEMPLEGLLKEESLADFQQDEKFQIAIKKLQQDIQNCK
ncbi:hypothetical protein Ana3638_15445 [Anaerocolumna sedimenticola]|uniref:Uncharacterized protein n=1 Tax=Anaerocolumna sedimenticola TaxID=2696063 RepID=A0A6P1TNU3_9FIRM|nr:hypothetical protein [Anaerocolumna sedimenticola]QHQ62007.1 hypothetical protein Ana3638_15445 [Anaerocolumna sedimenticola]